MTMKAWRGPQYQAAIQAAALRGLTIGIHMVEGRAIQLITSPPKTGKVYRRRGVTHQASAPGQAPASDSGRLAQSRVINIFPDWMIARLTFRTDYAMKLEIGTSKMEPRPFGRRALAMERNNVIAAVAGEIRAVMR